MIDIPPLPRIDDLDRLMAGVVGQEMEVNLHGLDPRFQEHGTPLWGVAKEVLARSAGALGVEIKRGSNLEAFIRFVAEATVQVAMTGTQITVDRGPQSQPYSTQYVMLRSPHQVSTAEVITQPEAAQ